MDREDDRTTGDGKKPWSTPSLRTITLTEEERAALEASDDPMALLLELRPELTAGQ